MTQRSDIEIARGAAMLPIEKIASKIGLSPQDIERYGDSKAKVGLAAIKHAATSRATTDDAATSRAAANSPAEKPDGKLILVTAITPTPAGEGKTTTSVGLADALSKLGKNVILTLREPSLGPVFGMKGGAAGGGYSQVVPMDDINLHFTGDFHAVGAANNLLAAMIDNHIYQGNELGIDTGRITWKRCVDMNDRQLRSIVCGLSGKTNGVPREEGYDITVASEIMAVLCLSDGIASLKESLKRMIVGYRRDNTPVTAGDLNAQGALTVLLKDAIKPNLVQTLENTPAFIHGGPFANIAHGCNSVTATKLALKLADYVVTEAGFGADLGAEKFCDIKCRKAGIVPSVCVIVATLRALKHHGGADKAALSLPDSALLEKGLPNLIRHIDNMREVFGLPVVVAINRFPEDTDDEIALLSKICEERGAVAAMSDVFSRGGDGGLELAKAVLDTVEREGTPNFRFAYDDSLSICDKISAVASRIYRASSTEFLPAAKKEAARLENLGFGRLPVCIAKTQYSFSDDPKKLCAPTNFEITVRNLKVSAGAGFIVALTGDIMTMPGLPKTPAATRIDIDENGVISGLS